MSFKICVYAISKNEEKFVKRFCESAQQADLILIADTGSTDNTVALARECGAVVHNICITPWRFDHARNASLALVPGDMDICVMMDLDEVLEPGWREEIESLWAPGVTRLRYIFDWGHGLKFNAEKIHARHGYYWHHPCHEYPRFDPRITELYAETQKQIITHYPDESKSRGQYLELLEVSVKEDPHCPRNAFYYARELFFYGQTHQAISELKRYLALPTATWHHERCYAMRLLSQCYERLGEIFEAEVWALKAAAEAPYAREPWVRLADLYDKQHRAEDCRAMALRALSITHREMVYTTDPACWGARPHDLLAIASWRLGLVDDAIKHGTIACELDPQDERLQSNLLFYHGAPQ